MEGSPLSGVFFDNLCLLLLECKVSFELNLLNRERSILLFWQQNGIGLSLPSAYKTLTKNWLVWFTYESKALFTNQIAYICSTHYTKSSTTHYSLIYCRNLDIGSINIRTENPFSDERNLAYWTLFIFEFIVALGFWGCEHICNLKTQLEHHHTGWQL